MLIFLLLQNTKIVKFHHKFGWMRMLMVLIALHPFLDVRLAAAPLENGFAFAPKTSATSDEKDAAYKEARSRLIAAAGKYEHTPYRYGGVDQKGLDCSGLVSISFLDALGITVPRNAESLYSWVEKIPIEEAQPGDLVFFKTTGTRNISHVGILTGEGLFIHSASEGPVTGVIYSELDETYWSRAYAGTGRALPSTGADGSIQKINTVTGSSLPSINTGGSVIGKASPSTEKNKDRGILIGFAAAPTWNTYFADGNVIRGAAGQLRFGVVIRPLGIQMILGAEIRPEWDNALGVFRLPLTFSLGLSDKLRFFAGPALSFGNAALDVSGESRQYSGGTNWFGAVGLTFAPFAVKFASNDLAPYGEIAWQSYFNNSSSKNIGADFAAGFRFSTGLRLTWRI